MQRATSKVDHHFLRLLTAIAEARPIVGPHERPFDSSDLTDDRPTDTNEPGNRVTGTVDDPTVPIRVSFSAGDVEALDDPDASTEVRDGPTRELDEGRDATADEIDADAGKTTEVLGVVHVKNSSFFLCVSVVALGGSTLGSIPIILASNRHSRGWKRPKGNTEPFPLYRVIAVTRD